MTKTMLLCAALLAALPAKADEAKADPTKPAEANPKGPAADELAEAVKAATDAAKAAREATDALREALEKQAAAEAEAKAANDAAAKKAADDEAAAKKKAAEKKPTPWVFNLGVNLISVTGNANSITTKLAGAVTGQWGAWAATAKADGAYGQTTAPDPNNPAATLQSVTAYNGEASLRGDRHFGDMFGAYVTGGGAFDHVASIERQLYGEAGLGITWLSRKDKGADWDRVLLRSDFGFRATQEQDHTYYPEDTGALPEKDILAPRIALTWKYALSKTTFFSEEAEVLPDIQTTQNVRASSATLVSAQVDKGIALQLSFNVRYIGEPAPGKKPTDTELGGGVSWTF